MVLKYPDMNICIGFGTPEYVHMGFINSLIQLISQSNKLTNICVTNSISSSIVYNRNTIVENAKSSNATHLLWIDADMVFHHSALERLISHNKDIVCATACRRDGRNYDPIGQAVDEANNALKPTDVLVEMKHVGMPFMLVNMDIYKNMEFPYFYESSKDGGVVGEDLNFCDKVRELGYQVWCDMPLSLTIGHIGAKVHYIDDITPEARIKKAEAEHVKTAELKFLD